MAYKPVPAKDRPLNKNHYDIKSYFDKSGANFKNEFVGKRGRQSGGYRGDSDYYHRNTKTSGSSKYYRGSTSLDRKVDPHDKKEAIFDIEERIELRHHERDEASRARRTQAEESSWKTGLIRRESQGIDIPGFGYMEGPSRYESIDHVQHSWLELSDHDKAMERQRSAQSFQLSSLLVPEAGKTERLLIQNKFQRKNERSRHRLHMFDGILSLFRDRSRYRHIARENKKAAKRERRRIVVQRGYY